MESPKFITCPECSERYNDTYKRRLIDTCGHPRCYSCLFKDNPCPICSKLPHGRVRARTLSNEKLLEGTNEEANGEPRHQRHASDTATFSGMFRKDSYLRTLYSYDPGSKGYNMEEKIRRYRSLEILNDKTRHSSLSSSDFSSDVFVSSQDTTDLLSLSSSIDELDKGSLKSPTMSEPQDKPNQTNACPKAWPSCPELSLQENIWQMRPLIERRKRPSSLYHTKHSTTSPRSSFYSPRSSGYWSELEQLSESESFSSPIAKHPADVLSPLSQDTTANMSGDTKTTGILPKDSQSVTQKEASNDTCKSLGRAREIGIVSNKAPGTWQRTRSVLQQWRSNPNHTRSTESLRQAIDGDTLRQKTFQRIPTMPVERHNGVFETNLQRKAYMTDV